MGRGRVKDVGDLLKGRVVSLYLISLIAISPATIISRATGPHGLALGLALPFRPLNLFLHLAAVFHGRGATIPALTYL